MPKVGVVSGRPSTLRPSVRRHAVDRAVEWGPPVPGGCEAHARGRFVLWDLRGQFSAWWRLDVAAHRRAFITVVGRVPNITVPAASGPDPLVAAEIMAANGVAPADVGRLLPRYLPTFAVALGELAGRDPDMVPRPADLLRTAGLLAEVPDAFQSFIAWEIRPSIRLKFRMTGLDRYLNPELGACGSDHTNGARLAGLARERVEKLYRRYFDDQDVLVWTKNETWSVR